MASIDGMPEWLRRSMQVGGAGLLMIGGPVAYVLDGAAAAGVFLGAGAAALILSLLDRVEQFAAWGLSAKLREAQAAANEAVASAAQVRALALPLTRMALGIAMGAGRWGGTHALRVAADEQAHKILEALGASPAERWEAYRDWSSFVVFDEANRVCRAMRESVAEGIKPQVDAARQRLVQCGSAGAQVAPASEFELAARGFGALSPEVVSGITKLAELQRRAAAHIPLDGPPQPNPDD